MEKQPKENRRRYLRYRQNHLDDHDLDKQALEFVGFVDVKQLNKADFNPKLIGMLTDQSHSGCSLSLLDNATDAQLLQKGLEVLIKVGPLAPLHAVVRWRKDWEEGLAKVGFEFLE